MVTCAMLRKRQSYYFHLLDEELEHGEIAKSDSICAEPVGEPDAPQPMAGALEY